MARILVTTFTNMPGRVLDSFRQGFIDALAREGNEVLVLRTNDFLADCQNSNKISPSINQEKLLLEILHFEPDIVFSMNHSGIFESLSRRLDCLICVWLLDGPSYLVDPGECKRQRQRYHMLIPVRAFRADLKDGFAFPDEKIHYVPFASDFQAQTLEIEHNIVFVGTHFAGYRFQEIIQKNIEQSQTIDKISKLLDSYAVNRDQLFSERLKNYGLSDLFQDDFAEAYLLNTLAINNRIKILAAVQPLGLSLFGSSEWLNVMPFSIELALSYKPRLLVSKSDLEHIYNSSLINLNISHTQARGGLPWRVFDVMACNGVLVSDYQEDLKLLFSTLELPIYHSAAEAHALCAQLLKDEARRSYLAEASQIEIRDKHRMLNRILTISEATGLCLQANKQGFVKFLDPDTFPAESSLSAQSVLAKTKMPGTKKIVRENSFCLQLFHSERLDFDPLASMLVKLLPKADGSIKHEFKLPDSKEFLRLDIGEYFSRHKDFSVKIFLDDPGSVLSQTCSKKIDLKNEIIASYQFSLVGNSLICGFDAYCIIENPYPGRQIVVAVETTLEASIWSSDNKSICSDLVL